MGLCYSTTIIYAQFTVTPANSQPAWEAAIQSLQGQGVTISNINVDCGNNAFATFTKVNPQDIIDQGAPNLVDIKANSGFILSTGDATDIGPNGANFFASTGTLGQGNDADLANYIDSQWDICTVTFDVVPLGEDLNFNYVFASEEYPEYVCTAFNDAFGFFISGPGINGPFSNNAENIALVPDITNLDENTDTPVSIGSINWGNFVNNDASVNYCGGVCGDGTGCPCNCPFYIPNNTGSLYEDYMVYDGQTILLTARQTVEPCETYSIKMVIADRGDGAWDSAVFVEAGSLTAKTVDIVTEGGINADNFYTDTFGNDVAVEDCVDQQVVVGYNFDIEPGDLAEVYVSVSGSGEANDLETQIPLTYTIAPGDTQTVILIEPIEDFITEAAETIIIQIDSININACNFPIGVSDTIFIVDKIQGVITEYNDINTTLNDTLNTCAGTTIPIGQATPQGSASYNWYGSLPSRLQYQAGTTPADSVIFVSVDTSMMVYCEIEIAPDCFAIDSVFIDLSIPPSVNNYEVCPTANIELEVIGLNQNQTVDSWSNDNTLLDLITVNSNNTATFSAPNTGGTFVYDVAINDNSCTENYNQTITITVGDNFLDDSISELFKCPDESIDISVPGGLDGFYNYSLNGNLLSSSADATFTYTGNDLGTLQVIAVGAANCVDTVELEIKALDNFADAGLDMSNCYQAVEQIGTPAINGYTYLWTPSSGLNADNIAQPVAIVDTLLGGGENEFLYTVTVTDPEGCSFDDAVFVTATNGPDVTASVSGITTVQIGESTTLNGSGADVSNFEWFSLSGLGLEESQGQSVQISPTSLADSMYVVFGYDDNGCFKTDTVTVEVIAPPTLVMPTAFSPNGDNVNDIFKAVELIDIESIVNFEVFNRWGKKVYQGTGNNAGWNGDNNDEAQPLGVYLWLIEYQEIGKTGTSLARGSVTLIR